MVGAILDSPLATALALSGDVTDYLIDVMSCRGVRYKYKFMRHDPSQILVGTTSAGAWNTCTLATVLAMSADVIELMWMGCKRVKASSGLVPAPDRCHISGGMEFLA